MKVCVVRALRFIACTYKIREQSTLHALSRLLLAGKSPTNTQETSRTPHKVCYLEYECCKLRLATLVELAEGRLLSTAPTTSGTLYETSSGPAALSKRVDNSTKTC